MARSRPLIIVLLAVCCLRATCQLAFEEAGSLDPEDVRWNPLALDDYEQQQQQQSQYMDASNMLTDYMNQPDEVYSDTQDEFPTYDDGMAFEELNFEQAPDYSNDDDYAQERQYHQEMNYHRNHGLDQYPISSSAGNIETSGAFEETGLDAPMQLTSLQGTDSVQPAPESSTDYGDSYTTGPYPNNLDYGGFSGDDIDGGDPELFPQDHSGFSPNYQMESAQISSGSDNQAEAVSKQQRAHFDTLLNQMASTKDTAGATASSETSYSTLDQDLSDNRVGAGTSASTATAAGTIAPATTTTSSSSRSSTANVANVVYTGEGKPIDLSASSQVLALEKPQQPLAAAVASAAPQSTAGESTVRAAEPAAKAAADNSYEPQIEATSTNSGPDPVAFEEVNMSEEADLHPEAERAAADPEFINTYDDAGEASEADSSEDSDHNSNSDSAAVEQQQVESSTTGTPRLIPTSTWKPNQQALYEAGQTSRPSYSNNLEELATGLITARRASGTSSSSSGISASKSPGLGIAAIAGIVAGSVAATVLVGYVIMTARTRHMQNSRSSLHEVCGHSKAAAYPDIECAQSYVSHSNPSSPATSRKSRLAEATYAHGECNNSDVINVSPTRSPARTTQLPFSKLHKGH